MEETLNLEGILEVIKKNLTLIFGAVAAFATAFLMTPQYEANTQVLVTPRKKRTITTGVNSDD